MNHLVNITKKELRELLTPGTIASILIVVIMFSALGTAMSGESEKEAAPKEIGIVYGGDLNEILVTDSVTGTDYSLQTVMEAAYKAIYNVSNPADHIHPMAAAYGDSKAISDEVAANGYSVALAIPSDLKTNLAGNIRTSVNMYYAYSHGGIFGTVSSLTGSVFVNNTNSIISTILIDNSTGDSDETAFVKSPLSQGTDYTTVNGQICEGVTPYQIYSSLMGQSMIIPIIVMIIIVMVGSVVISSMGSEKENKTLETLLTMPIKRTTVVSGKLLAAAIMGLVYGVCYLAGMMMYSNGLTSGLSGTSVDLSKYGLVMDAFDWVILMLILFLAIFCALGICMILGAFTKNYKMAQTMTLPISGLAIIPMFIFMFTSWENLPLIGQAFVFAIPFSHPMMAMDNLMFGNMLLVLEGIAYLAILDIVMILITVKIYNSDVLITGLEQSKFFGRLTGMFKRKEEENEYR